MKSRVTDPVVKICGLRRREDAELAVDLGAGYLGCVLAADSPRCATIREVEEITAVARGRAEPVLVFRSTTADGIIRSCDQTGVRRVQVHGTSPVACQSLSFYGIEVHPVFRVLRGAMRLPEFDPLPSARRPAVLDGGVGGAGETFAWSLLRGQAPAFTFIAGGITDDNVSDLLAHRPFGVDVSSGLEAEPGVKDPTKVRRLFERIEQHALEVRS